MEVWSVGRILLSRIVCCCILLCCRYATWMTETLIHGVLAAFFSALIIGLYLHYHKIVKNEFYGYPQEWFPSVSATIGDRYPERSFFMIFIAITSGTQQSTQLYSNLFVLTGNRSSIRSCRLMVSSYAQAGPEAA